MIIDAFTPPTEYTAICYECGYKIYFADGKKSGLRYAEDVFIANGWREDDFGRPICPDCYDELGGDMTKLAVMTSEKRRLR